LLPRRSSEEKVVINNLQLIILNYGNSSYKFRIINYMASERINRVNELIRSSIAEIISRELDMPPGVFLTVTKVDTSADLRYARVFVSVFPEKKFAKATDFLQKKLYTIQGILNKKLHMKPLPRIELVSDRTELEADKIEKILKKL
jgi:ribosome-binding factor A